MSRQHHGKTLSALAVDAAYISSSLPQMAHLSFSCFSCSSVDCSLDEVA